MNCIDAFIEASIDVISKVTESQVQVGKVYEKTIPYASDTVVVLIGLTGMARGNATLSLSANAACHIASVMMGGMPVPELDEIAKSAIGELCNMILGTSAMLLSRNGVIIDLTPPTVLTGENIQLSIHNSVITCIPIELENIGLLELDISFEVKK